MSNTSFYCDDCGVLLNKFDIHDDKLLREKERDITILRIAQLRLNHEMIRHYFCVDDYLKIHKFLFSDIYFFAGEIRNEAISKSNEPYYPGSTPFCYPSFIYEQLNDFLKKMSLCYRKIHNRDDLLDFISYFYSEINMVHPFREGNGRTLRIYMELLVEHLCSILEIPSFEIHYSLWEYFDRENLLKATILSSITADTNEIRKCFDKVLVEVPKKKKSI